MFTHRARFHTVIRQVGGGMTGLCLAGVLGLGTPVPGAAQDGTGVATPAPPDACAIPAATIDLENPPSADASPIATSSASPIASPVAADPLTGELLESANRIAGCLNEQDTETYAMITSDDYRGALFGLDEPLSAAAYEELASTLPDVDHRIVELGDVEIVDEATTSATVTYITAYQQRTSIWTFVQEEVDGVEAWVLDDEEPIAPVVPEGAEEVTIEIADARYDLSSESIETADVVFSLTNDDDMDHEALVLRFASGTSTDDLLRNPGPALPEGVTFIGQATIPGDAEGTMVLTDLAPGTYTIVCLLPDEEGLPLLASGMVAEFTVE